MDDHALITSDNGIAVAARECGIDALRIRPGFIALKGLNYGFIGGTCGLIGPDELLFAEGTSGSIPIICGSGNRRQSWEKDFSREYRESVRLWKHHSSERMQ